MGRSDFTYDDQHREAIARAALEDGLSAREAVEKAAAGELYGLEPFEPAVSTAQDWIAAAKREGHSSGYRDRLDSIVQRALEVIEAEMEKINPNGRLELPRAKRAIQLAQHVARLVPLIDAEPPATPTRSSLRPRVRAPADGCACPLARGP